MPNDPVKPISEAATLDAALAPTMGSISSLEMVDPSLPTLDTTAPRYAAGSVLGAGGMGEVRLDRDSRIGREVAVKRLHPGLAARPDTKLRFLREARVQGQLEHPSIVPVYDLGTEGSDLFFAMKRVRGRTLSDILAALAAGEPGTGQRYGKRRLLSAFSQVCLAVDYAHARGVVHRDLKPHNVMLGDWGEVYVLDWGVAKVLGSSDPEAEAIMPVPDAATPHTAHGAMLGTPGYMSPEQASGDLDRLGPQSDVFSLGAILYELLALEPMIPRSTAMQMAQVTLQGSFEPPSSKAPDVAPELEALWADAVHPTLDRRLPNARALSEGIERFLDGDRDREMRRARALEHAERAKEEAERAFASDDLAARRRAAREAGSALAFDPEQPLARSTLGELLTRLPETMPDEARASYEAALSGQQRDFHRVSVYAITVYAVIAAAGTLLFDLRALWPMVLALVLLLVSGAVSLYAVRSRDPLRAELTLGQAGSIALLFVPLAMILSPVLVLPVIATVSILIESLFPGRARRGWIALVGMLPLAVYGALDIAGVVPSTIRIEDGVTMIEPWAGVPPEHWMLYVLLALSVFPAPLAVILAGRVSDQSQAVHRALHVSRWQLAQVLPQGE